MFQPVAGVFAVGQLAAPRCGEMQEAVSVAWGVAGALGVGGCLPESAAWGYRPAFPPAEGVGAYPAQIPEQGCYSLLFSVADGIPAAVLLEAGFPVGWFAALLFL